ncbi:hypothetical protein AYX14_07140 [Cryptococcus neoformans]|nr:hypothetical protein AYX14_07140 [Cryptococcus neoformans var. grubii]
MESPIIHVSIQPVINVIERNLLTLLNAVTPELA